VSAGRRDQNKLIYIAIGGFGITCVVLFLAGSLITPDVEPGFPISQSATPQTDGTFQLTVDTKDRKTWVPISLGAGKVLIGVGDPDIALRRYVAQAPGGAANLGDVALADARVSTNTKWVNDTVVDGEVQNETLSKWYSYSYWTHLLRPKGNTYAVRLKSGGVAYLRFVSYYCEPEGSGCLTIRYRLERG